MDEKRARLKKLQIDMGEAQHDSKLSEVTSKIKALDDRRELLNNELRTLGLQSDVRAKLNLAKEDIKAKSAEILNTYVLWSQRKRLSNLGSRLELANVKVRKLTKGKDVTVDALESEVNRLTTLVVDHCGD